MILLLWKRSTTTGVQLFTLVIEFLLSGRPLPIRDPSGLGLQWFTVYIETVNWMVIEMPS